MSVTELRDDQANEWEAWARNNPDDVLEHNKKRRDDLAAETSGKKVRLCEFVNDEGEQCMRRHYARSYCRAHWRQLVDGKKLGAVRHYGARGDCEVTLEGLGRCPRPVKARGLCEAHYHQMRRGSPFRPVRTSPRTEPSLAPPGSRNGEPWTEWEFDLAMSDTPLREVALRLGRTYSSVVRARQRRRRMLGLGIEYTKSEADPYDGSDRRGVLYAKEKK